MNTNEYFQMFDPLLNERIYNTAHEKLDQIVEELKTIDQDIAWLIVAHIKDSQRFKWLVENTKSVSADRNPEINSGICEWKFPKLIHINAVGSELSVRDNVDIKTGLTE